MSMPTLHLPAAGAPAMKPRAKCGATSGRVVDADTFRDSREGKPCPTCLDPKPRGDARKVKR